MKPEIKAVKELGVVNRNSIHTLLEEGEFGAMLDMKVWNPKTGEISFQDIRKSESYVRQFLDLLYIQMNLTPKAYPYQVRDTGNTLRDISAFMTIAPGSNLGYIFDVLAGAGTVTYGIVVGTDNTAPTISDYALGTLVTHGVGAGQLQYSVVTFGAPAADATTSQLTITRNFANGSGGGITVEEVGLYCRCYDTGLNAVRYAMIIRDVTGGILVPNGQTLTVNYRPQAVV